MLREIDQREDVFITVWQGVSLIVEGVKPHLNPYSDWDLVLCVRLLRVSPTYHL